MRASVFAHRFIAVFTCCALSLSGCRAPQPSTSSSESSGAISQSENTSVRSARTDFTGLDDPALAQYTQDSLLADLESSFSSDDITVEDVNAVYVSKEYLEESAYNNQSNIYFGYTLDELTSQFGDTKYVFTLGEDGQTAVTIFEEYDDSFDRIAQNVAIGGGVILVCVVVTVATGGTGAPAAVTTVHAIFAASAKSAANLALSGGAIAGVLQGIVTGIQTGDIDEALEAAALAGSESFKWGAIIGAITGGGGKTLELSKAARAIPTPRASELEALNRYGGSEQVTYLNGVEVPYSTAGATRPDLVINEGGKTIAYEVKNYDLVKNSAVLKRELTRQITERVYNLPQDSEQRVILDVRNRGYSAEFLSKVTGELETLLKQIDPSVVVELMM